MLYPDKETADDTQAEDAFGTVSGTNAAFRTSWGAMGAVAFCSQRFGKHVSYIEKNMPFLVLSFKGKGTYVEVLAGDRKGWIVNEDFLKEID